MARRSCGSTEGLVSQLQKQLSEAREALAVYRNRVAEQEAAVTKLRDELERERRATVVIKVLHHQILLSYFVVFNRFYSNYFTF